MTAAEQKLNATRAKAQSVRTFSTLLNPYIREIMAGYQIGQTGITADAKAELTRALRLGYIKAASNILRTDIRQYKADDDIINGIYIAVGAAINQLINNRAIAQSEKIANTSAKWVDITSTAALENGWTQAEAKAALLNHLSAQRLTISTTESQAIIEGTRQAVVLAVRDPLSNTIEEIARLVSIGDINGARRLSRSVVKLVNLPLSISQGDIIRIIEAGRERLMVPEIQGRIIATMRERAAEMQASEKEWGILGFNTRDTHQNANGQRQLVDAPFILAGGMLMYPGDASLGAALSEIINCNCYVLYL